MTRARVLRARPGFTVAEIVVSLTIAAIIMTAMTAIVLNQSKLYTQQDALRSARTVSRASLNMIVSELRLVEAPGGVAVVARDSIVVLVPYALGITCAAAAGSNSISLLPTDSISFAEPGFSGYAWRSTAGDYTYTEGGIALAAGGAADCTAANISVLTGGGRAMTVSPGAALAGIGTPTFLFRRISYRFRPSTALPGRIALWRTVVAANSSEELVAPFDSTARFRFYVANRDTAQDGVPALTTLRGVEMLLYGKSTSASGVASQKAEMTTAAFFKNRMD